MALHNSNKIYPYHFLFLYAFTYACNAVYNTFVPVYLKNTGFSQSLIGTLLAMGPFVAVIAQPLWGMASDRAKTKNQVLKLLIAGSAVAIILFPLSTNFYYIFALIAIFTFFQTSINPISDTITLECLENTRWKFGPIRLAGTLGFALTSIITGTVANLNINNIFILYFAVAAVAFLTTLKLPSVKGHQSGGTRVALWEMFKNRELVLLLCFNMVIFTTLGYYYSFFPIYYRQMGADNMLLGISAFVSAISELPFLLLANKILEKFGIKFTLICSAAVMGIRWLLLFLASGIYVIPFINALHGFSFIVFSYCFITYINKEVPKELRASGQTMNVLVGMGIARIIGSIAGGVLSDAIGVKRIFLYNSILNFLAIAIFGSIFLIVSVRKGEETDA